LAWWSGNAFNAIVFAILAIVVAILLPRRSTPVRLTSSAGRASAGAMLVALAWIYPHFLVTSSWTMYLYASPLGLIPCPTLAAMSGIALLADGFGSRSWAVVLAAASLFYGVIGVFRLGVTLDVALIAGALLLGFQVLMGRGAIQATLPTIRPTTAPAP
jgi:hypothetical protein